MSYTIIIPARMHSTRLPKKMLRPIDGEPLIYWSWRAAQKSAADQIIIATDHEEIYQTMKAFGAKVVMTSSSHETGTDRLSEVVTTLNIDNDEIILNWQGDEPFLPAALADNVAERLQESNAAMATLATPLTDWADLHNPNIVKIAMGDHQRALYFSRAPIPFPRDLEAQKGAIPPPYQGHYYRHIGLYAYRTHFLKEYPTLSPSPLEELERLEQLRALANGYQIEVLVTEETPPNGIDTAEDLENAIEWFSQQR